MTEPKTHTLDVPGAVLHYDVRDPSQASTEPVLLIIGSPMGADGFTTLAGHFADRTVVTYDPRGVERSASKSCRYALHVMMLWPSNGSSREPSSSAGSPNMAGSGPGWSA